MKKIVVMIVVLSLVGGAVWIVWRNVADKQDAAGGGGRRRGVVAVALQPVRREDIREVREFTGTVYPKTQFLVAPKVAGRLEKLMVNIGQTVTNGALIALLDSQEYRQQVAQARAELEVAAANVIDARSSLDIGERELNRVRELRKQKIASEAEMDQAEARYNAARASLEVAQAQVKQREAALRGAEVRLSYTRIEAAWEDGGGTRVIGERFVDEGAMLRANDPIVSILDIDTVIATLFVIERDYPNIHVGQPAVMTTDAFPNKTFVGQIARMAPLLKESSRQARVEIEIANQDHLLAPGMFVRAGIEFAARERATVVPVAALVRRDDRRGVFLVDTNALTAHFVPITVGILTADTAEVLDPALDGQVATLGQHLLEDGVAVLIPGAPSARGGRP